MILRCANCVADSERSAQGWRVFLTGEEIEVDGIGVFARTVQNLSSAPREPDSHR